MTENILIDSLCIGADTTFLELLGKQNEAARNGYPAGISLVVNERKELIGTITDGDIRRATIQHQRLDLTAGEMMNTDPIYFPEDISYKKILESLPYELQKRGRKSDKFLSKVVLVNTGRQPVRIVEYHQLWEQRVANHRHIVVVGMGYVGFTLALVLADHSFRTSGFDISAEKIAALQNGKSYIHEKGLTEIFERQLHRNFHPVSAFPEDGDVFIISVGTPVMIPSGHSHPAPELSYLESAARMVGARLRRGNLVVLRSTVPVGTTRDIVLPLLETASGLKGGIDFHLSFAPERTAEGKAIRELRELPQIIGGINEESTEATAALFRDLTPAIIRVKSLEQAEIAKLLNNCFRDLIFSFSNQMAAIAHHFNVDIVETIKAANQGYPRDPIPMPSPGVGGACLTKDPYIFASVADRIGIRQTLPYFGRQINEGMLSFVADRILSELRLAGKDPASCRILACGLAFKGEPETADLRNSTGVEIAQLLQQQGATIYGHDPVAEWDEIAALGIEPVVLEEAWANADAVLFLNNHRAYEKIDLSEMIRAMRPPAILFDGWKLFDTDDVLHAGPCIYLGLSFSASSV